MAAPSRRPASRGRPGLTLIELLAAIALTGAAFLLLLPRLAPPLAASAAAERGFIGVQLGPAPTADGYVQIRGLLLGRPAQVAGALPGDAILRVDGFSMRNRCAAEVVHMITRGRPGTRVRLTVRHPGAGQPCRLTIRRGSFLTVFLPGFAGCR
jgi:S1-C subfamily serine protease